MLKGVLIFTGGAVIGGASASIFWLLREKKEVMRHEAEIAELKNFYSNQADARAQSKANELVKSLMAKGYLVKGQSSLDNPELVTADVIAELEAKEWGDSHDREDADADGSDETDSGGKGPDPPQVERRNFFDTHQGSEAVSGASADSRAGPKEAALIRDRESRGLTPDELSQAHRHGMDAAKQDGHYTRYSAYSRSRAKQDTRNAIKSWAEEAEADMIEAATEAVYDESGALMTEEGPDEATLQHVIDIPPGEKPDTPIIITREQFENEYPLYEKEVFIVYLLDSVMCREDGEVIDDSFMYVGVTEPATLWPPNWEDVGAPTLFVRNHRLGIDIQIMPLFRSYAEDMAGGGEYV